MHYSVIIVAFVIIVAVILALVFIRPKMGYEDPTACQKNCRCQPGYTPELLQDPGIGFGSSCYCVSGNNSIPC